MSRFYLRIVISLFILFMGLSGAMIAIGSTQPIHPALRGFVEGCEGIPQPCWYGIVVGSTSLDEAQRTLAVQGYTRSVEGFIYHNAASEFCDVGISGDWQTSTVLWIYLQSCSHIPLGSVLDILGTPQDVHAACDGFRWFFGQGNFVGVSDPTATYNTSIADLNLHRHDFLPFDQFYFRSAWQGLGAAWRYSDLNPDFTPC